MLERSELRIEPLRAGPHGWLRTIRCAVTADVLGHAFRVARGNVFGPRGYSVHEEPDGALLTTVRRRWWLAVPAVFDSEGRPVATLGASAIHWADGRSLAEIHGGRHGVLLRTLAGVEIARWDREAAATVMRFHPRIADEPIVKMCVLAAALMAT
ncbi:MAG: hypothetical protein K1X57_13120 [Gemmataceae bacterium]|nr:hypothetical protein [Gemmataceae bacterium]